MHKTRLSVGVLAACLAIPAVAGPAFGVSTEILRLKFDETVVAGNYAHGQTIVDASGTPQNGTLDLQGTSPGFVTQVTSPVTGFGKAMKFGTTSCPGSTCSQQGHVKIEDSSAGAFTPGSGNFEWGATVQLTAVPDGAMGMNVIQKGRSGTEDMWKLQLDAGKASCVLKIDNASPSSNYAKAQSPTLTVGHNYKLRCKRVSGVLTLVVTELAANGSPIGSPVTYSNSGPAGSAVGDLSTFGAADDVYVGGKGTVTSPDQLRGTILDTVTYWAG